MAYTPTPLKDLAVGDLIFTQVYIDKADMADPNATSGTANKIRAGQPVDRIAVVLVAGAASVQVAYLATFNKSQTLPASFDDKTMWYPIAPAMKESIYDPLPARPPPRDIPMWVCLRNTQTIVQHQVNKMKAGEGMTNAQASALLILAAMKA